MPQHVRMNFDVDPSSPNICSSILAKPAVDEPPQALVYATTHKRTPIIYTD